MNSRPLQLYITAESPCGYFADKMSRNLVPDPELPLSMSIYNLLIQYGFRRSGEHCYRPHCKNCHLCVACRIPVREFISNRSQQRCLNKNNDLLISTASADFNEEYFELYRRYLNSRHFESSMANPVEDDFKKFLYCDWSDTRFLEFRLNGQLVAVAVSDILSDGVSAVYSFFEPELEKRSLGTYCILKQIDYAKELGLSYVYLGYWIEKHAKMHYKANFKPLQLYLDEQWQVATTDLKKPDF
jgi:arginyl-tRNA--protein-N-Asp/Glu arginylyltransferase